VYRHARPLTIGPVKSGMSVLRPCDASQPAMYGMDFDCEAELQTAVAERSRRQPRRGDPV